MKMKITKDRLLNFLTDLSIAYELPPLIEKVEEVIEALQNEELEIEGYERTQWTKFDPKDESTHPRMRTRVLVWLDNNIFCGRFREFEVEFSRYGEGVKTVYWRPLPPPPGKEEMKWLLHSNYTSH